MSRSEERFGGCRPLVTGACRGMGAAIDQRLAAEGGDIAFEAILMDVDLVHGTRACTRC